MITIIIIRTRQTREGEEEGEEEGKEEGKEEEEG